MVSLIRVFIFVSSVLIPIRLLTLILIRTRTLIRIRKRVIVVCAFIRIKSLVQGGSSK